MFRTALIASLTCSTLGCASALTALPPPDAGIPAPPTAEAIQIAEESTETTEAPTAPLSNEIISGTQSHVQANNWIGASGHSDYVLVGAQEQFVGVWVDVPHSARRAHVPMSLTLSIDTSGSMAGTKIAHARQAARALVERMHDGDIVAIHSFSGTARELIRPTVLSAHKRPAIMRAITRLRADGATNLFDALQLGSRRAQEAPASHPIRRVVIISDGRATAGPSDPRTLANITRRHADVQITALGVGLDYDEQTLNALAMRSNGRLYHLADARELSGIIASELDLLQSTMATAAFVEVVPAPGVRLSRVRGSDSHWSSRGALRIPLGVLFAGQHREFLVGFRVLDPRARGQRPIASARLHYRDPSDNFVPRIHEVVVRGSLTDDAVLVAKRRDRRIEAIVEVQNAAEVAQSARRQLMAGQFDDADASLARAERQLRASAAQAKSKRDRKRLKATARRLAQSRHAVRRAAKAPPSARPAAARAGSLELNDTAMEAQGY